MSVILDSLAWGLVLAGLFFFFSGAAGLIRFPDVFSRLHAVTKADNAGLGLLAAGLALKSQQWHVAALLLIIWLLVMASGTTSCQLLARYQREQNEHEGKEQ